MRRTLVRSATALALIAGVFTIPVLQSSAQGQQAQAPASATAGRGGRGGRGGPQENWWVAKSRGGVYAAPNRPIWRKAELLKAHAGQNNWSELIIRDAEQEATYNSGAPGSRLSRRLHPDTTTVIVVLEGELAMTVEGQQPVTAKRGAILNIMKSTIYSWEVTGSANALWVQVHPANYRTAYPVADTPPAAPAGHQNVRVAFNRTPAPYGGNNRLMNNTFDDYILGCRTGAAVDNDHIWVSPLLGYVNAAENRCNPGQTGNIGSGPLPPGAKPFDPAAIFGHMHAGPAEWWIVQVGRIRGQFEGMGEYHAEEGDVLYAAPMMWHQMGAEATSGPNVRLAFGAYQLINMNNTAGQ